LGVTVPVPSVDIHVDKATLYCINRANGSVTSMGLDHAGAEVFAILHVRGLYPEMDTVGTVSAMAKRFARAAELSAPIKPKVQQRIIAPKPAPASPFMEPESVSEKIAIRIKSA